MAGGGHAMAAGLSIRPDRVPEFRAYLCDALRAEQDIAAASEAVEIDALITTSGATRALYDDFQRLAPFGPGNPEPLFALAGVRADNPMALKGGHVRVTLTDGSGGKLKAIAWRAQDSALGTALLEGAGGLNMVGKLTPDDWQGRNGVQLEIEDVHDPRRMLKT